jgi:hypothetical protein
MVKGSMVTDEDAVRIVRDEFAARYPAWPRILVQEIRRGDGVIRVSFFPESKAGIVNFFTRYLAEVDVETGKVLSLR